MALQVWLPLNGNLNNQGLSNLTFSGSPTFESGKLGQSARFGSNSNILTSSAKINLGNCITISFWVKIVSWINWGRMFVLNSDNSDAFGSCLNDSSHGTIGTYLNINGTTISDSYAGNLSDLNWHHFALVVDENKKKHYLDGKLINSWTMSSSMPSLSDYTIKIGGWASGGSTPPSDMNINDFRIYDHALSDKEVKDVSKLLVLHWPLNNNGIVSGDISSFSSTEFDCSGYGHNGKIKVELPGIETGSPKYKYNYKYTRLYDNVHYNNTTDLYYTDNFSFCLWIKHNYQDTGAVQFCFVVGRADYGEYGYGIHILSESSIRIRYGSSIYSISCNRNEWTHIAFTKSGKNIKMYRNGSIYYDIQFGGAEPTYGDGAGIAVGSFYYSGGWLYPYYGSLSDLRIYGSVLSAEDVKEIYQTSAIIDNKGSIYCYEFVES